MQRLVLVGALLAIGAAWGLSMPLAARRDLDRPRAVRPHRLAEPRHARRSSCRCSALAGVPLPPVRGNLRLFAVVAGFGAVLPGFFTFLTAGRAAGRRALDHHRDDADVRAADGAGHGLRAPRRCGGRSGCCSAPPRSPSSSCRRPGVTGEVGVVMVLLALISPFELRRRGDLSRLARPRTGSIPSSSCSAPRRSASSRRRRWRWRPAQLAVPWPPGRGGGGARRLGGAQRPRLLGLRLADPARRLGLRQPDLLPRHRLRRALRRSCSASATARWSGPALALMLAAIALVQPLGCACEERLRPRGALRHGAARSGSRRSRRSGLRVRSGGSVEGRP